MGAFKDLTGKQFGDLTVIGLSNLKQSRHLMWRCVCACGNELDVQGNNLTSGNTTSCRHCGGSIMRFDGTVIYNLCGAKIGYLDVIEPVRKDGKIMYRCICNCGREVFVRPTNLFKGHKSSCGQCGYKAFIDAQLFGKYNVITKRLAKVYGYMVSRCYNQNNANYRHYGGRGIKVCDKWLRDRQAFIEWALVNGYEPGLTIERINVNDGYSPENCKWVTPHEQTWNKRSSHRIQLFNISKCIAEWAEIAKTKYEDVYKLATTNKLSEIEHLIKERNPAMFNLLNPAEVPSMQQTINFNTDSMFDIMTGSANRGFDGKWYINGGLGPAIAGVQGRAQSFKSAFAASLGVRMSALYDSQMLIFDSELALVRDLERVVRMAGDHADKITPDYVVPFDAKNKYDLENIRETIRELGEKKKALGKDAMCTTPFIDRKTGERIKVYRPTCIFIDSYTECFSREEESLMSDKGLDDSRSKTLAMLDANKKTIVLRHLNRYAAEYGIELVSTAHYGSKLNLDPYAPNPKYLQWGNQNDAPKNVGSKWGFLTSPLALVNSCTKLMDDAHKCKYALTAGTNPTDLSEIAILIQRCKNNASGTIHPFVVSQDNGLLTDASDYSYLRNAGKGFSMQGNNITHQSMFLPDVSMTRNSFRGICQKDKRLIRALQLGAQLLYIQSNWNTAGWPFPIKVEPKALVDALMSDKDKMSMDRILASRGYWLPDELITPDTPEFMSIFDILEFFHNNHGVKLAEKK